MMVTSKNSIIVLIDNLHKLLIFFFYFMVVLYFYKNQYHEKLRDAEKFEVSHILSFGSLHYDSVCTSMK
jgi:hypothetical protein